MLYLGLTFLGIIAFSRLGIDLLPNIYLPHLVVQTTYSNATPEEIEKLVTEPLESSIGTVSGVKKITSVSKEGISVISVDFVWGTDMDMTVITLREKLDNISFALPRETGRPTIIRSDPSGSPIMSLVLTNKTGRLEQSKQNYRINYVDHSSPAYEIKKLIDLKEAARVIFKRRLEQIDGVAQAIVTGGLEREILVEIDPLQLENYDLTYEDVSNSLKAANINLPAGSIMKGLFRYSLRTLGEFTNKEDIENTVIKYFSNGSVLYVKDIAEVRENFKEREGLTRLNGNETIGLLIYKQPESNTVNITQKVKSAIQSLKEEYPEFGLTIVSDQSGFIENAILNVKQEILYGGILASIVLFFFLANLRNIFAIAITIPASLVITILLMYVFKINFNIISLGGIAVGIGMLLDNSIIVIENIVRYKEDGYSLKDAVIKGTSEVSMPVVAATLTTIVVFLPLIFIKGIIGELFRDQALAIVFSLSASIVAALTLIPMIVSREQYFSIDRKKYEDGYFIIKKSNGEGRFRKIKFWLKFPFVFLYQSLKYLLAKTYLFVSEKLDKYFSVFFLKVNNQMERLLVHYEKLLLWSLNNKAKVVLITVVLIVLTAFAAVNIKKEFIPPAAQDEFVIELLYPKGTSLEGNAVLTSEIEKAVMNVPNVRSVISNIGRVNEFDFLNKEQFSVEKTNLIVKLESSDSYYDARNKLRDIFTGLNGIEYSFQNIKTSYTQIISPSKHDIEIKIKNNNIDEAIRKANLITERIKESKIDGIKEIVPAMESGLPGYNVSIDREKCKAYGISVSNVVNELVALVKGSESTYFSDFDKKVAVRIRTGESNRDQIEKVLNRYVRSGTNKVRLSSVVDIERIETYPEIWREDQARTLYIYADIYDANIEEVIKEIEASVSGLTKYPGEVITIGGVNEEIEGSFSKLYTALLISVLLMYIILASEFESLLYPFIIIFSVPLGLIGGILSLYILGESISIISLMGLIILVGIADNDAVVKMEFILRKRKEGLSVNEAILQAGKDRFRPIVMNSLTVIFGLIPMIIGIGAATQLRVSLAIAIAGGLVSATLLTLIIIPVLYSYLEKFSKKY